MMYEPNSKFQREGIATERAEPSNLETILMRLAMFIEQETQSIASDTGFDYKTSSERKSRLLLELNRASRLTDPAKLESGVVNELRRLKALLVLNEAKIKARLSATREVSDIVVGIIRNEESDGTYANLR